MYHLTYLLLNQTANQVKLTRGVIDRVQVEVMHDKLIVEFHANRDHLVQVIIPGQGHSGAKL